MSKTETHPFQAFVPSNATVLIVGSFPGREQTQNPPGKDHWFYGAKRNQFWKIISAVYNQDLSTREEKQHLFEKYGIGITDIFLKIKRKNNTNLDNDLEIIEYNDKAIRRILSRHSIERVLFTSRFVGLHFLRLFPWVKNTGYLPSPSPRYARMSLPEKIEVYRDMLPR